MSMVFCRGCGKEIHESAVTCPSCGAPQNTPAASEKGKAVYTSYDQVPWYRKTLFLALCFIFFPPALLFPLLSGNIYYAWDGQLKTHSKFTKGFLIFWAVAAIFIMPSVFRDKLGTELNFNKAQLFYTSTVTKDEAERLGNYLVKQGLFGDNPMTVQLNKSGNTYQFRMVGKEGIDRDPDVINSLKELNELISENVFNSSPVETHICNDKLKTIRVVVSL